MTFFYLEDQPTKQRRDDTFNFMSRNNHFGSFLKDREHNVKDRIAFYNDK